MGRTAYVDESYASATAHYLLAAVVVDDRDREGLREATQLVPRRARSRFHWHSERRRDRVAMVAHLAGHVDVQAVAISQPVPEGRTERARATCLGALLGVLAALDPAVEDVVIESRTTVLDKRDVARVGGLQSAHRLPASIRLSFSSKAEPLLWLPDALAGAVNAKLAGDDRYTTALGNALIRVHVGPTP